MHRKNFFFIAITLFFFSCSNQERKKIARHDTVLSSPVYSVPVNTDSAMLYTGTYHGKGCDLILEAISAHDFNSTQDHSRWVSYFHFWGINNTPVNYDRYHICRDSLLKADSGIHFVRDDSAFTLILRSGITLSFPCSGDEDSVQYDYQGCIDNNRFLWMSKGVTDAFDDELIISSRTGTQSVVDADPQVSPSGKYFFSDDPGDDESPESAGLQLFRVQGDSLATLFAKRCFLWSPRFSKWVNDSTLVVEEDPQNYTGMNPADTLSHYARIRIRVK